MKRKLLVGAGLSAAASALAGLAAYAAHRLSGPTAALKRETLFAFTPFETGVDWEEVSFNSVDGLQIRAWWLGRPESKRVVIGCHGHRGRKDELLGIGSGLWRAGMNVLIFDFRGRGDSDDSICSLAYHEVGDLHGAIKYVESRLPEAQIGVIGYSMGAAVSLLGSADQPAVKAVVADSGFAEMANLVDFALANRRLPRRPLRALADQITAQRYGYRFEAVRPIEALIRYGQRPLLVIHCTGDTVVPVVDAYDLYAAAQGPKELWIVEDMPHCGAYFADRPTYVKRVVEFFERYL